MSPLRRRPLRRKGLLRSRRARLSPLRRRPLRRKGLLRSRRARLSPLRRRPLRRKGLLRSGRARLSPLTRRRPLRRKRSLTRRRLAKTGRGKRPGNRSPRPRTARTAAMPRKARRRRKRRRQTPPQSRAKSGLKRWMRPRRRHLHRPRTSPQPRALRGDGGACRGSETAERSSEAKPDPRSGDSGQAGSLAVGAQRLRLTRVAIRREIRHPLNRVARHLARIVRVGGRRNGYAGRHVAGNWCTHPPRHGVRVRPRRYRRALPVLLRPARRPSPLVSIALLLASSSHTSFCSPARRHYRARAAPGRVFEHCRDQLTTCGCATDPYSERLPDGNAVLFPTSCTGPPLRWRRTTARTGRRAAALLAVSGMLIV